MKPVSDRKVETYDLGALDVARNIRAVDPKELVELVASIKEHGILQPILVTSNEEGDGSQPWRVIDGHRRVKAAQIAGLKQIAGIYCEREEDHEIKVAQLVANLHRADLSPLEEAQTYQAWLGASGKKQKDLAKEISRSESYVSNRLRLLKLGAPALEALKSGKISASVAEQLLSIPAEAVEVQTEALRQMLAPVRQNEEHVVFDGPSAYYISTEELIRTKLADWRKSQEWRAALQGAKFPTCPGPSGSGACGDSPRAQVRPWLDPARWEGTYHHAVVGQKCGHYWDLSKGALVPKSARVGQMGRPSRKPAKAQERREAAVKEGRENAAESPVYRSAHTIYELVARMIEQQGEAGIIAANYTHDYWTGKVYDHDGSHTGTGAILAIEFRQPPIKGELSLRPCKYTSGERTQVLINQVDGSEKARIRGELSSWETRQLRKTTPKPDQRQARLDPELLSGSLSDIVPRVAKLDTEHLELARDGEAKGRGRKSVLEAIDLRLGLLWARRELKA